MLRDCSLFIESPYTCFTQVGGFDYRCNFLSCCCVSRLECLVKMTGILITQALNGVISLLENIIEADAISAGKNLLKWKEIVWDESRLDEVICYNGATREDPKPHYIDRCWFIIDGKSSEIIPNKNPNPFECHHCIWDLKEFDNDIKVICRDCNVGLIFIIRHSLNGMKIKKEFMNIAGLHSKYATLRQMFDDNIREVNFNINGIGE